MASATSLLVLKREENGGSGMKCMRMPSCKTGDFCMYLGIDDGWCRCGENRKLITVWVLRQMYGVMLIPKMLRMDITLIFRPAELTFISFRRDADGTVSNM
jgi:hypothetical protein